LTLKYLDDILIQISVGFQINNYLCNVQAPVNLNIHTNS
jgi:hypothetical protein